MPQSKEPTPQQIQDQRLYTQMGMTDAEFEMVQDHLGRLPNYTELGLFSVMWSEHCSYKNSKPVLRRFPTEGDHVLQGPGEGAGIVDIGDGQAVVFKMESHNHPSAIEPYQGAATGVGGILRDVFSMGARPIALLNSLRFGPLSEPRVKYLFEEVVAGIAGYGNCVGVPTVGGDVYFDPCYTGNPLVNAMCVGLIDQKDIKKGLAVGVGNSVIYVGASTGRDGIHGATFASEELSDASEEKRPAVQVGDPFMEKLLLEACLELIHCDALKGIQDMGAAGLVSSSSEMASKAGNGIEMDLDKVPQRETQMTPYEMMLSESQERMLLVVEKGREAEILAICEKFGLSAAIIGKVIAEKRLCLWHKGQVAADVPVDALAEEAPVYNNPSSRPRYMDQPVPDWNPAAEDPEQALRDLLREPTVASKRWVYDQYDHMVRTNTVVAPGSDAAVLRIRGTNKALAMTSDCNSRYVYLDPKSGGAAAVAEAARNVVCSGGKPLAITDCLNYGRPENPEVFWQLEQSAEGIREACLALQTPVISGNVSLYNERQGTAIYPTPMIGLVGLVEDLEHITTQGFKKAGSAVLLLGETRAELGGSQLQYLRTGANAGRAPQLDVEFERKLQDLTLELIRSGRVLAAHDTSEGGLGVAAAEMAISGGRGVYLSLTTDLPVPVAMFSESHSRILLEVSAEAAQSVVDQAAAAGVPAAVLGTVMQNGDFSLDVNGERVWNVALDTLRELWEGAIPCALTR